MTVTEAPPDERVADAAEIDQAPATGLAAVVGSGDPRSIGKLFVGTSLLFLLMAGVTGALVGLDLANLTSGEIIPASSFEQVVTLHQVSALFLVVMPLLLGLALAVVPLQVGASTVAFPRASAAAYWVYLVSGGLMVAAYIANGGPFGGDGEGVGLFVAALVSLIVALCVVTISIMTTVLTMRPPGMTLRRTPLLSWSMVVAGTIWLLTLPILAGLLVLFYVDFTYGAGELFTKGSADLYDRVRWVFWQPAIYAFAVPALGIIGDVVPVFAQRRHHRHSVAMILIGLFGALSFGAWLQLGPLPTPEETAVSIDSVSWLYDGPWIAASVLALLPLLGLLGLWTVTLLKGRARLESPLLLVLGAGLLLVLGVAAGLGTVVRDLDLFGTTWVTGQAYAVLVGTLIAAVAGLIFWAPKMYGRLLPEALGRTSAPLFLVGGLLLALPYAIAGVLHQPWLVPTFVDLDSGVTEEGAVEVLDLIAAIGGVVVLVAVVLIGSGLLRRTAAGKPGTVDDDPWNGHTLEWTTSSPPSVGNFAEVPEVTSEAPLYDKRHAEASGSAEAAPDEALEKEGSAR